MLSNPPALPNHQVMILLDKHRVKNKSHYKQSKLKNKLIIILNISNFAHLHHFLQKYKNMPSCLCHRKSMDNKNKY